ncbi:MAG: hypothetical protein E5X49_23345 [Mesorhizobium sp.]|uniref:restriction endonuclease subunit S n=1 Tax=Mesorhizobium sp. TaxID=1871066 RepID=UPI000FE742C4|nr:restriction endonuclease subunit S [Mesorhizobium sp.]RWA60689.1 MAG: restriction endonuclease subunit S [Mesorhizobium sp.]RWB96750.1 MAG: restriction endonuclease subunit S [Mesorhizobium sp.]TIQ40551.1 MAG: hypothetical protein E5X49_23345 [Mesorhizobium sp.]
MSIEVPAGWSNRSLGSLIDFVNGFAFKPEDWREAGTPIVRIQNLNGSDAFNYFEGTIPERYHVRAGDLLFCWSGSRGTSFGARKWQGPLGYLNQHIFRCVVSSDLDFNFAYFLLEGMTRAIEAEAHGGGGLVHIKKSEIVKFEARIPPLDEQRRIAEVLRSVDRAIAANRSALHQMVRAQAATLHVAFEETDWEPVKLGTLGRWQSGGTPSKADASLWNGDVPWVCPRDMKVPVVRRTESSVSSKAVGGACKIAPKGSLMIVVRGMILAKAIPTAITAMDATFNQDIKAFQPNERVLPKFIQLCLQHQERELLRLVNTATHGTKKLDADTIAEIEIPLPDLAVQQELSDAVADMDLAMAGYGEEHIRLTTLKNAVRDDLFSGRVRVSA